MAAFRISNGPLKAERLRPKKLTGAKFKTTPVISFTTSNNNNVRESFNYSRDGLRLARAKPYSHNLPTS